MNLFIPNPEWFIPSWINKLKKIDAILCKTRDSELIFKKYGNCVYTSWTSEDKRITEICREECFCHLAGSSNTKNTHIVNDVWDLYENLPPLYISKYGGLILSIIPKPNKYVFSSLILSERHKEILNRSRYHLCPSEYEGFGLYIWEGLSTGNLVIVPDHTPMNSIGIDDRCIIPVHGINKFNLASVCRISNGDLFNIISNVLLLSDEEKNVIGNHNRKIWEDNDVFFRKKIIETIKEYNGKSNPV